MTRHERRELIAATLLAAFHGKGFNLTEVQITFALKDAERLLQVSDERYGPDPEKPTSA